jgi:hypothetical protein
VWTLGSIIHRVTCQNSFFDSAMQKLSDINDPPFCNRQVGSGANQD